MQSTISQSKSLGYMECLPRALALEMWELGALVEEVVVRYIKIAESLLQTLGVGFLQPGELVLLLELGQHGSSIKISQAMLALIVFVCGVVVNACSQEVVIHETARAELLGK